MSDAIGRDPFLQKSLFRTIRGNIARYAKALRASKDSVRVFGGAFCLFILASIYLMQRIGPAGDEPWYVLQGLSIVYYHTVDMSKIATNFGLYHLAFGHAPSGRLQDFLHNGVLVITYLPGYAAIIGFLYAIGGRLLIVVAQSTAAALTAVLLFQESLRLWHARSVAIFAVLAYVTALPTLLYTAQLFPSTIATVAAFGSFVLVIRLLPSAQKRRRIAIGLCIALLASLLPWLHIKYAPLAVIITAAALLQLLLAGSNSRVDFSAEQRQSFIKRLLHDVRGNSDRYTLLTLLVTAVLPMMSFLLILWYDTHYFGTWYPQYSAQTSTSFMAPDVKHMFLIYEEILLGDQSGLIPWVPLVLLAPAGLIALFRRHAKYAFSVLMWILGLIGTFLSSAIAPHVNQAFALPGRFSVESIPFLVICCCGVFSFGLLRLRAAWKPVTLSKHAISDAQTWAIILSYIGVSLCLLLLLGDAWLTLEGEVGLPLLYPSTESVRIVAAYPHWLTGWWFSLFFKS